MDHFSDENQKGQPQTGTDRAVTCHKMGISSKNVHTAQFTTNSRINTIPISYFGRKLFCYQQRLWINTRLFLEIYVAV